MKCLVEIETNTSFENIYSSMNRREFYIKDSFKLFDVPFLIRVYDQKMYINGKNKEIRGINTKGNPSGLKGNGRKWLRCKCMVAKVRPDYPYNINNKWTNNIDKHVQVVEPYEIPERKFIFYGRKERTVDTTPSELAKAAINQIKSRFDDYEEPASLDEEVKP